MNITVSHIKDDQYYKQEFKKTAIVLHHTAGGPNPHNTIFGWNHNAEKVGTAYVIAGKPDKTLSYKEGEIIEAFPPQCWAHHLGTHQPNNTALNQNSIGIEICNWGQLVKKEDGKYYNYVNKEVPSEEVNSFSSPYRGFNHYHKYSDAQLASLLELLKFLSTKFSIDLTFKPQMFDVNQSALNGAPGLWTHTSYRADKVDLCPQPNLLNILIPKK